MSTSMFGKISLVTKDVNGAPQTLSKTGAVLAAVCLAIIPLDISQLVFALIGAFAYAAISQWQQESGVKKNRKPANNKYVGLQKQKNFSRDEVIPREKGRPHAVRDVAGRAHKVHQEVTSFKPVLQPSVAPISAPVFKATGWNAEVEELIAQLAPTAESEKAVQQLARRVQQTIRPIMPEVEVVGFASSNFSRGTAFGVAVPEVDLVANVNIDVLVQRFQRRNGQSSVPADAELRKLQKTAVRTFTDRLVASAGFKFRRSAFRGNEPKVTLLAPMTIGTSEEAFPLDFAVNSATPLRSAALLSECDRIEPRAKSLILLVKRWAKDRGICHVAKGHFSPYAWSVLAIYFLQTRASNDDGCSLPPMGKLATSGKLAKASADGGPSNSNISISKPASEYKHSSLGESVGCLFKQFIAFYANDFDWHSEAVSVRTGKRAPPELSLPLHIVLDDAGTSEAGPSVEDPFEISHNLGDSMNSSSLARLHEELSRAQTLISQDASLTEMLKPWEPEGGVDDNSIKDADEDKKDESFAESSIKTITQSTEAHSAPPRSALPSCGQDTTRLGRVAPAKTPPWRVARVAAA